jgi:hypothetical protein
VRQWPVIIVLLAVAVPGCGTKEPEKDVVVVAGDRKIDFDELNRSYVLQPKWKRGDTRLRSYLTQASELVTQKLYAQEAERLRLEQDSSLQGYLAFVKEKEMIKGLYRQEIRENVKIDEAETRRMYLWLKKKVDFSYVFAHDSSVCASYAGLLTTTDVDRIPAPGDSSVRIGKREQVKVGSVAPELERELFTAELHNVRGPIRVGNGFMAVKITGGSREAFVSDSDFNARREQIEKMIADRKRDSLANRYVARMMREKDLRLNGPVFWAVADYFLLRVREEHIDPKQLQTVYITSDELRLLDGDLRGMGDAVVATHKEGVLTVRQLMVALSDMPGSLRPRVRTPQNLKDAVGGIVRNQYLAKEAARQGLDKDPGVLREYRLQRDEALASAYFIRRRGEVQVTPGEVEAFRKISPISEEQVFFKFSMTALARDAKVDSILKAEGPALASRFEVRCDTAKIRSMVTAPDEILKEEPIRMYLREIFM